MIYCSLKLVLPSMRLLLDYCSSSRSPPRPMQELGKQICLLKQVFSSMKLFYQSTIQRLSADTLTQYPSPGFITYVDPTEVMR